MSLDGWARKIFTNPIFPCIFQKATGAVRPGMELKIIVLRGVYEGIYERLEIIPVVNIHNAEIMSFSNAQTSFIDVSSSLSFSSF